MDFYHSIIFLGESKLVMDESSARSKIHWFTLEQVIYPVGIRHKVAMAAILKRQTTGVNIKEDKDNAILSVVGCSTHYICKGRGRTVGVRGQTELQKSNV